MISLELLALVRCPDCRGRLTTDPEELICQGCGRRYHASGDGYLDFRPAATFSDTTKYLDEALHADARHETVSPPLLSAAIRNDLLRDFLAPRPGDRVLDLGCGSGRVLLWNRDLGAYAAGIDISAHFAAEARAAIDLVRGDLRRLPFADAAFTKAYALDVFEHLTRPALDEVLRESARVLAPGGALFVYSHVRQNARLALGLRAINRLARFLERRGLVDLTQERLRKSDHQNPLADVPDLERHVRAAGFHLERICYYTPLVGGFVENILIRLAERALARRAAGRPDPSSHAPAGALREARATAKRRIARRGWTYRALRALTVMMKLDVLLFGRIRSGPFFALLRKS